MKRNITIFSICTILIASSLFFSGCFSKNGTSNLKATNLQANNDPVAKLSTEQISLTKDTTLENVTRVGDEITVSRALVVKMLSLTFATKKDIDTLPRVMNFSDVTSEKWYDRYINSAVAQSLMSGSGELFSPDQPLTLEQAQILLDKLDPKNKIQMVITDENRNKPISYELWVDLYIKLLKNLSGGKTIYNKYNLETTEIIPLVTPETFKYLKPNNVITDSFALTCSGYSFEKYVDKSVRVIKKDGEVVAIIGVFSETPTIYNALVVKKTKDTITIFSGGAERTYSFDTKNLQKGDICDITIKGKTATKVVPYSQKKIGTITKITENFVDLADVGRFNLEKNVKIYSKLDGKVSWKSPSNLIVGSDIAEFVLNNGNVVGAIITKTTSPKNIRVVISKTSFTGYVHKKVEITSDKPFSVFFGKKETKYKANDIFKLDGTNVTQNTRYVVVPAKDAKLQINNIKRNWENNASPKYRGKLEILSETDGYVIVNELPLDEYLYAVIPSEILTSYGVEACKAQAVTARSYAYNQFFANRFAKFGAHVDDSVSCQVYNRIPENNISISATQQTKNQYLAYDNKIISANFFGTSSGMTANAKDVWALSTGSPYLSGVKQYTKGDYGDLSKEENAAKFFKDLKVESYDSASPWFRWNISMTRSELENSINKNLKARYLANPAIITTLSEGLYKSLQTETIGTLKDIEVVKRGNGGNIVKIKIVGSKATIMVETEYNIRTLFAPKQTVDGGSPIIINRANKSTLSDYALLPSSFFTFDKTLDKEKNITAIKFYGGGNGHGVGMSQDGVEGMIDAGFTWQDILTHYYTGSQIVKR